MHSLFSQRRAHGNREPVSGARTAGSLPAPPPRRGWRPLLAGTLATAFLALAAASAYAQGAWLTVPSMPTARSALAGVTAPCPTGAGGLTGTCVYAIGGRNSSGFLSTVEAYSPATKTWATLPSMPTARSDLAGVTAPCPTGAGGLTGTCVYAIGGFNGTSALHTVEAYSPATNGQATLPTLPTARADLAGATAPCPTGAGGLTGTCVYAIGGNNGGKRSTVEAYSPAANVRATLPSVPTARDSLAGATAPCPGALDHICVYAIGGSSGGALGFLNTVETFAVER